jgi:hypothetical protein
MSNKMDSSSIFPASILDRSSISDIRALPLEKKRKENAHKLSTSTKRKFQGDS